MTLNQILEEFNRRANGDNYVDTDDYVDIKLGTDTLCDESRYPESRWELDHDKVKEFITFVYSEGIKEGRSQRDKFYDA